MLKCYTVAFWCYFPAYNGRMLFVMMIVFPSHSIVNPIVYAFMSKNFRQSFKFAICACVKGKAFVRAYRFSMSLTHSTRASTLSNGRSRHEAAHCRYVSAADRLSVITRFTYFLLPSDMLDIAACTLLATRLFTDRTNIIFLSPPILQAFQVVFSSRMFPFCFI